MHTRDTDGYGTLRVAGTLGETIRATGEFRVASGRVAGLPVSELHVPAELEAAGGFGAGTVQVRRWSARLAGGQVRGDARFRVGYDRSFQGDVALAGLDLELIARTLSPASRPASGKISGRVALHGTDPAVPRSYRGNFDLDLDDASLVSIPFFREVDRFLGAARGGLFEHGDLTGSIANRQFNIDPMTLEGRLAQLHVRGTVGFDGQLNLVVLINTNQLIPETGAALAGVIPGLNTARGRNGAAMLQVANFLSNRLLKLRVTGTVRNPSVNLDPGILVADTAVGFFTGVLKLPLGLVK
jgi:translocation and assembly module TamB